MIEEDTTTLENPSGGDKKDLIGQNLVLKVELKQMDRQGGYVV